MEKGNWEGEEERDGVTDEEAWKERADLETSHIFCQNQVQKFVIIRE